MYSYPTPYTSAYHAPLTKWSYVDGISKRYGSIEEVPEPTKNGLAHLPLHPDGSIRARFDFCSMFVSAIIPAIVFAIVAGILSFYMHYASPLVTWVLIVCCLFPAAAAGILATQAQADAPTHAKWLLFVSAMSLFAWVFGIAVGNVNYGANMLPYYEMLGLNLYPSVDPSLSGEAFTDTGRVLFQPGSKLDMTKAMGVRVTDTYCVVPVVSPSANKTSTEYDFWAVGINCCSSVQPQKEFTCRMTRDYLANAGMRWMDDSARPYFRMAVQEAEATFKIQARHPIFLNWVLDPTAELASWRATGWNTYLKYAFGFLVFMCFSAAVALFVLSAASMQHHQCKGTGFEKYARENPYHDPLDEENLEVVR
mmetsp:Transcript_113390/g.177223  ORF Transcript_113390/g.177223 Transcript_113390/m.177223 type:complete len:366 (+) Transcript_113390:69-1166(+)